MNFCPQCAHQLEGRATEWSHGRCPKCEADIVIKLRKPGLTVKVGDMVLIRLEARVKQLEAENRRLREKLAIQTRMIESSSAR